LTCTPELRQEDRAFLRHYIEQLADGVREDLDSGRELRDPDANRRELASYERLIGWLSGGGLAPGEDALRQARLISWRNDQENEFARATREHLAFVALTSGWQS
jgi:hypothetical protein